MTYVTSSYLSGLKPRLTPRDLAITAEVGRFKLMTASQILRVFFQEPHRSELSRARRCQAVLSRLTKHGVLARLEERDETKSFIYCLDIAGQRIAEQVSKRPRRKYAWYSPLIWHTLAIAELWVRLIEAHRAGELILHAFETEPRCWREFSGLRLKPDAYIELDEVEGDKRYRSNFYIEIDRGTQYGTKVTSKLPAYNAFWNHLEATGRKSRGALILTRNETRSAYLMRKIGQESELTRSMYSVAIFDDALFMLSPRK